MAKGNDCLNCKKSTEKVEQLQSALAETKLELQALKSRIDCEPEEQAMHMPLGRNQEILAPHEPVDTPVEPQLHPTELARDINLAHVNPSFCIAIKSAHSNHFLGLSHMGLKSYLQKHNHVTTPLASYSRCAEFISGDQTFEFYHHEDPSVYSFKVNDTTTSPEPGVYLRAMPDPTGSQVPAILYKANHVGYVTGDKSCTSLHVRFRIHATGYQGRVLIESLGYPEMFLRMDGSKKIGMQNLVTEAAEFVLVVVPPWEPSSDKVHRGRVGFRSRTQSEIEKA